MGWIVLLMVLNFAISWFNAWAVGKSWIESKHVGGWPHFINWCAAIMSACGFTWVYLLIIGFIAYATGYLPEKYLEGFISLGYTIIIFPVIGTGIAITIDSWAHFWRKRSFGNGAVAVWNTFADFYNIYQATRALPGAFDSIGDLFDSDSDNPGLTLIVIFLVAASVIGGILTTVAIVRVTSRNHASALTARY